MNFSILSTLSISGCLATASFASAFIGSAPSLASKKSSVPLGASPVKTTSDIAVTSTSTSRSEVAISEEQRWASHALLFSSLSDGVLPNTGARSFLRYSLAKTLLREHIAEKEDRLKSSVEFSPCNGPSVEALNNLESVDQIFDRGQQFTSDDFDTDAAEDVDSWANEALKHIISDQTDGMNVRVLYIPTAMYALNPNSSNTPGKQRQRARSDGKKRRTQLSNLVDELLTPNNSGKGSTFNLLATTLDLDDGSLKQPVGSEDTSLFPQDDQAALSTWQPHLIYVEGGNTFWLQHCIDKGNYSTLIRDACTGLSGAVYCGKSAGAIVAGRNVATATWKGWDDPSVVTKKPSYDDWLDCRGFQFADKNSFFPHMNDDWSDMVAEKVKVQNLDGSLYCLREEDACCVVGEKKISFVTSGPTPLN